MKSIITESPSSWNHASQEKKRLRLKSHSPLLLEQALQNRANFYWDVTAYLAEEAKVPVRFLTGVDCMAQALNPDSEPTAEDVRRTQFTISAPLPRIPFARRPTSTPASHFTSECPCPLLACAQLPPGVETEVALWQLATLSYHGIVDPRLPKEYEEKMRRELQAERADVNLHLRSNFYYDSGSRLNSLYV